MGKTIEEIQGLLDAANIELKLVRSRNGELEAAAEKDTKEIERLKATPPGLDAAAEKALRDTVATLEGKVKDLEDAVKLAEKGKGTWLPSFPVLESVEDNVDGTPFGVYEGKLKTGWGFARAVSFKDDQGYNLDTIKGRAEGCIALAFGPQSIGLDSRGLPEFKGFPQFDIDQCLYVAAWIGKAPEAKK